jgi:NAD(P)-dependent dehydrogenase (short-subunit alcohol dehydrogenase family)
MKTVVVTGSTRGIGLGLAREFLKRGCQVVVTGRSQSGVDKALTELNAGERALGQVCDVGSYEQLQALWDAAAKRFGTVDYWINNAGIDIARQSYWELPKEQIDAIVQTNLIGVMYASHIVLREMLKQGSGQLFNMEGFGSEGRKMVGIIPYGTTKYALRYFTKSLQLELKDTPIIAATLSPGIVITDLLMDDYKRRPQDLERAKRIFNILGDTVETVTPFLAEGVLANTRQGAHIAWLTTPKIITRFMTSPFNKRDLFASA